MALGTGLLRVWCFADAGGGDLSRKEDRQAAGLTWGRRRNTECFFSGGLI